MTKITKKVLIKLSAENLKEICKLNKHMNVFIKLLLIMKFYQEL